MTAKSSERESLAIIMSDLVRLDRYERRALSRRKKIFRIL